MADSLSITPAAPDDLDEVLALLSEVNLPHHGIEDQISRFVVARDRNRRLVGCAGLERYGEVGLLRSVAVLPVVQHTGLGSQLTVAVLDQAASEGVREVVLLTNTARDFFDRKFGFTVTERSDYDKQLSDSPEWRLPCCSSAVTMKRRLTSSRPGDLL